MKCISVLEGLVFLLLVLVTSVYAEDITTCMEINSPGEYHLLNDLTGVNDNQWCIKIVANDVVLKGMGKNITGNSYGDGILIQASNVSVENLSVSKYYEGFRIEGSNVTISNISATNNYRGLNSKQGNIDVRDGRFTNNTIGVILEKNNNVFIQNLISNNKEDGLTITSSSFSNISSNIFESNGRYGLHISSSSSLIIENNSFKNDGILIEGSISNYYHQILNNTVNDKPLCYLNSTEALISDCGGIIAINSKINGNFEIENTDVALFLLNSTAELIESTISNCSYGIYLDRDSVLNATNLTVQKCDYGIYAGYGSKIVNANNILVESKKVELYSDSIHLSNFKFTNGSSMRIQTSNSEIINLSLVNISSSFYLRGDNNTLENFSIRNSYESEVNGNNITVSKIHLKNNSYGLSITGNNITVSDSIFSSNNHHGIKVFSANKVKMKNCTISDHLDGISIIYSNEIELEKVEIEGGVNSGIYIRDSNNISIDKSSIGFSKKGIRSYNVRNLTILNSSLYNINEEGLYLERTDAFLISSEIANSGTGVYSFNSNLTAINNIVCGNSKDFYSENWMQSYGENNSCDIPDGWNDTGVQGCKYSCFDCQRQDATYIRLFGNLRSSYSFTHGLKVEEFSDSTDDLENISLKFSNLRIVRDESENGNIPGFLSSYLNITYYNKVYNCTLIGIIDSNNTITGILDGEMMGRFYGSLNNSELSYLLMIKIIKNLLEIPENEIKGSVELTVETQSSINATMQIKNFEYYGQACGYYNGELNLSETRFTLNLDDASYGYGMGKYEVNNTSYNFLWIILDRKLGGVFSGKISDFLSGRMFGDFIEGVVYKEVPFQGSGALITLISGPSMISVGGMAEYRITVMNVGNQRLQNVSICYDIGENWMIEGKPTVSFNGRYKVLDRIDRCHVHIEDLNPMEEVEVYVPIKVVYAEPIIGDKIKVMSMAYVRWNESNISIEENNLNLLTPATFEIIDINSSLFSNDDDFTRLSSWLNNSGFKLVPLVLRTYYDTDDIADMAVFAREDGDFVLSYKAKDGYPILINMTNNSIIIFDDTGGEIWDFENYTTEFFGEWKPQSPTMGTCILNCLSSNFGKQVDAKLSFIEELIRYSRSPFFLEKVIQYGEEYPKNLVTQFINEKIELVKNCQSCFMGATFDEPVTLEWFDTCFNDCFLSLIDLPYTLGPIIKLISECAVECKKSVWSHACEEGDQKTRCSIGSLRGASETGLAADMVPGMVLFFECKDGEWAFTTSVSCATLLGLEGPERIVFEPICLDYSPPGGISWAKCLLVDTKTGFTMGKIVGAPNFFYTYITFAHDPNAKYVDIAVARPGEWVNYTVEFENTGNGTAYGVYVEDTLSEYLNVSSLNIGAFYDYNGSFLANGVYNPITRTIRWDIGEVPPKSGGRANFSIRISDSIHELTNVINYATVYFPSVLEVTTTNTTVTLVCSGNYPYIYNNSCVNCTSNDDCGAGYFCNDSHYCEKINNKPVPIAQFKSTAYIGETVTFNASESYDPDGDALSFYWVFGDGAISCGKVVEHAYSSLGIYNVTLFVMDNRSNVNSTSGIITVISADLTVTAISINPAQPIVGQSATINATIANIGEANAGSFNVSFFVNNSLIGSIRIPSLNANESIYAELEWTPAIAGYYSIKVEADSEHEVAESYEDNNTMEITVSVKTFDINECMDITQGGNYRLVNSISGLLSSKDYCIGIFANDVVLDGQGFSMTGSGSGKGILIQANNVTIANVNASAYDYGIYLSSSNNSTIANCYTLNNDETGIYLNYTTNSTIANNTVSNNNQAENWNSGGIVLYNSNYNKILENRITNNKFIGINVIDSHNNSFTANQILYNYGPTTVGGVAPGGIVFRISSSYPSNYTNYNLIKDNNITNNTYGIYFWSSSNNRVLNNTLSENQESAVHFNSYSDSNTIENNTISKNKLGISYWGCCSAGCSNGQSTKILNNTILNNLQGINLGTAKFATVSNNTIAENQELGILVDSGQHTISNNTISGNSIGLQISGTGNTIKDNTFIGGGVFVEAERNYYLYNNEFSNNFVNGKPLVYLKDARDVEITEAGQVFVLNSRNITIKDLNLIGTMTGVVLWHTSYSRVENCTISAKKYGIILEAYNLGYTNNTTIANSTISNSEYGIYMRNSYYNEIFNSTIRDNTRGVYFTWSNYNNITESRILWNQFGVCFDKATANNTVSGSEISNNSDSGVYLITDQYHVCINNTITNNLISNNAKGIYPNGYSSYTNISGNVIVGNSYGFYIDNQNSRFHIVYNNLFNNTNNVYLYSSWTVKWNTTLQQGTNILGGNWLGGNAWLNPDGTGYSQTCIDAQEPIGICDEVYALNDYNKDYLPLKYPMPDLIVESISFVPEQPVLGQIATIKATIKNIGKANANNFNVSFFVNDNLLEKVTIESLKASESISAEIDWTPSSAGSYTIKVIVDSDNNVIESNEENNEKNIEVLIQTTKLTISIYDENNAPVEAKIQLGEEIRFANATIFSLEEGTYELRIEKEGYIPVFANLSIKQGESKSITVKLYREENLTTPRAIMVEGTIEELNELISKVEEEFQNPNAVKNATKTFNLTITNERSLLAISMPIYKSNESASFFAFLEKISAENASIATENFTAYITPNGKEIKLVFEGRKLGDVNNDGKVSIVDALFIAQYLVGKRTLDNTSKTYANVNKDNKLSIVDALFIAQYLVGKRNAVFN